MCQFKLFMHCDHQILPAAVYTQGQAVWWRSASSPLLCALLKCLLHAHGALA